MSVIYIVEDDKDIREIESIALLNSGYTTFEFSSIKEFEEALKKRVPNLIILDIMLPDGDGNNVVSNLKKDEVLRNIPVIMVTAKTSDTDLAKGLNLGADDYIKKPFSVLELISRVGALLRRTEENKSDILQLGNISLDESKRKVFISEKEVELTYKEYELLKYMVINSGKALPRERIMKAVWGTDFEGESRTLDMHVNTLRKKMKSEGYRIKTVRNVGYIIE